MSGYLQFQNNLLIDLKQDVKDQNRHVYVFKNTEKLRNDISKYKDFLNFVQ